MCSLILPGQKILRIAWMVLCCFITAYSPAQVNYYTFSQTNTLYSEITNGIILGDANNSSSGVFVDPESTDIGYLPAGAGLDIGFDFVYRGVTYDRFGVSNNGWIFLGKSSYGPLGVDAGPYFYQQAMIDVGPANDTLRSRIIGFNIELFGNGSTSSLQYKLTGDAPDRILTIQWKDYLINSNVFFPDSKANFQIRLHETDGAIEIQYGEFSFEGIYGFTAAIGLSGFSFLEHHNRTTSQPHNWNATSTGLSHLDVCAVNNEVVLPEAGLTFQYSPSLCVPPTDVSLYALSTTSMSFAWGTPYTNPAEGFEYTLSESISPPGNGTLITNDTIIITGLNAGTQYYLHLRSKCSSSLFSEWFTFPAYTLCEPSMLPYFENFDEVLAPALPECMRSINLNPESNYLVTKEGSYSSFPNYLGFQCNNYVQEDDWLFTPGLLLEADSTYIVSLDFSSGDTLFVYSGPHPLIQDMIPLDTLVRLNGFPLCYTFYTCPAEDTIYFGFHIKECYTSLDDLTINKYDCKIPFDILTLSNTGDSVVIKWTPPDPQPMGYEYQLLDYIQYPPTAIATTSDDSILFSGLTPSKDYYLLIRSSCGSGQYSPWVLYPLTTVPLNDECIDALELIPDPIFACSNIRYSTIGATDSGIPPDSCGGTPDDDVWFKFTATNRSHRIYVRPFFYDSRPGQRTATAGEAYTVELYADSCGGDFLMCMSTNPGQSKEMVPTNLTEGRTYYLRAFGTNAYIGGSDFDICIGTIPTSTNDNCPSAEFLVSNGPICANYAVANLGGTTPSSSPGSTCDGAPFYDIWYKFVAIDTTQIVEAHFSNNGDGVLQAFTGDCDNLVDIGCINESISGPEVMTLHDLVIGDTVFVRVFDAAGLGANIETQICIRVPHPNEECDGAISISTVSGVTLHDPVAGNTMNASGTGSCSGYFADDDLWYKFIAVADTHLIVLYPTGYPYYLVSGVIELYEGDCESASIGCSSTGELLATGLVPGNEYYFKVYSSLENEGQGNFLISITIPPANYSCASAEPVDVNVSNICTDTIIGTTIGAGINNEVWYSFVATDSSIVARAQYIDGNNSFFLNFFDDCNGQPLVSENHLDEIYYQHFIVGDTYYIRINSLFFNNTFLQGSFSLCLLDIPNDECANAITIPTNEGCTIPFQGTFLGSTPSTVQDTCSGYGKDVWYKFTATSTFHKITVSTESGGLYAQGEVYQGSCAGNIIQCFTYNSYYAIITNVYLDSLTIGETYYFRLKSYINFQGTFTICVSSPPPNDDCSQPLLLELPLVTHCTSESSATGTTINGTNPNDDQPNVWYEFEATTTQIGIYVTPSTPGFDPAIRIWKRQSDGGSGDLFCTNGPYIKFTDITHANGQLEVMTITTGLSLGNHYLIEVCGGAEATAPGDFSICLTALNSSMKINSVDYKTYDADSVATAGKWQQPVVKITLRMSGTTVNKKLTKVVVNTIGTTQPSDIKMARLYIDTSAIFLIGDPVESSTPFFSIGEPSSALGGHPPPVLFGQAVPNPNGIITFTGQFTFRGGVNTNYNRDLYLVYDINCDATTGHLVNGQCTKVEIGNNTYTPFKRANEGLPIQPLNRYDTQQDGDWNSGNTWMCNVPPPDGPDIFPININHQVTVSGTQQCGDLMVHYLRSLTINPGSEITLGASSMGSGSGYSNKHFDCTWGSLSLQNAMLTVNGSITMGDHFHPGAGIIQVANSTLNIDGNDGTLEGSATDNLFNLGVPLASATNFNINILDPAFHDGNDFVYWGASPFGEPLDGTLKFGGGDDTNPASDEYGFYVSYGPGTFLRPDSFIVDGGLAIAKRNVSGLFVVAKHMKVMSGSEYIGSIVLNGDLINNGLITIPAGREISFCGEADFANYYTNILTSQTLSGSGFFRSGINDPIPSSQTKNQISKLQVANTYSGLTLQMPLGIKDILRIRKGKINSTDTSLLTLGDSIHPGTLVTVYPPPFSEDPNKFYETPFSGSVKTWDGGFVNGPMRRWFQDTTLNESSILPIGSSNFKYPVSVAFTSLDTGFITAKFINENPGPNGMPLINEQGVELNNVSPTGYWNITSSDLTDNYDLAVNATGFTIDEDSVITDLTNLRLIKRPDNGAWNYSGSTNEDPPISLDSVSLPGINGFSDFALGLNCNLVVTTAADSGPGSLRYLIEHCAQPGDSIKFAKNIQLVLITSDTIILDKNLSILNNHNDQVIIQTTGNHSLFKINAGVEGFMRDLDIHSGDGVDGRAILNNGFLRLEDVIILDTQTGGSAVYNKGNLIIIGNTEIRNE